jgi:inorganic pyrophosphatase
MPQQRATGINKLKPFDDDGYLNAVVEAVRGSRNKFKFDEKRSLFVHNAVLPAGASYPFDFGFIPSTKGEDGDPLDVLILMDEPAFVGAVIPSRLVGAIEATQREAAEKKPKRNDRLIAVAKKTHLYRDVDDLDDLPGNLIEQIEHFFVSYNALRDREFEPIGRSGPKAAKRLVTKVMSGHHK